MLFALQLLLLVSLAALRSVASFTRPSVTISKTAGRSRQKRQRSSVVVVDALDVRNANSGSSIAIPFLPCPPVLSECSSLAGNVGFDPLKLAKSQDDLLMFREMEVKHGRLAMLVRKQFAWLCWLPAPLLAVRISDQCYILSFPVIQAAAGWPVLEILDRPLADDLGMPALLAEGGRAPSLLNGGMEAVSPAFWGMCLGLTAAIDLYGVERSRSGDPSYFPGNLGFDPLGFYPSGTGGRKRMELAEIKHGRTAMMAVAGYAAQEYFTELGVVEETPLFFVPIVS
jgi:hypothetical protein